MNLWPRSPKDLNLWNFLEVEFECIFISMNSIATEKVTFSFKSLRDQICPCHIIGQGQSRVMIYIYFIELNPQMLHTKFQGNQPGGFGLEDYLRFLPYMGKVAILVM